MGVPIRRVGYPELFYLVVGLAEVSGAILLLIPRLARLGVLLLIVVMAEATVTHLIHQERQVATTLDLTALLVDRFEGELGWVPSLGKWAQRYGVIHCGRRASKT